MDINLIIAKETERLTLEGLTYNVALRKAKEMYKEKAQNHCDQTKGNEHCSKFNLIISENEDLDNGEVFDSISGQTIRDL